MKLLWHKPRSILATRAVNHQYAKLKKDILYLPNISKTLLSNML